MACVTAASTAATLFVEQRANAGQPGARRMYTNSILDARNCSTAKANRRARARASAPPGCRLARGAAEKAASTNCVTVFR